ncbi:hypothetical protein TG4357_01945 [Thalassovita gelatinovora]|uniref:Uncharacterized protein n=1 Tax=Thalassovita gelatinovora TaxID=53501 RepID=A0A0P1FY86_THAGE|nr:hypothetical protein [Thalassovita gelatinovora]QIZ80121.1 hypothetical protein HFZ77_06350 [Thalassovita gelatinovora]CUH65576.1 hypothetical protein TG4357_01945 [Thalassovita gelatinovora]SER07331.1 hypothetical protein SAMN04488043_1155 [Thalassovita gelatinovora]
MRATTALIFAFYLTGCADFPDLNDQIEPAARQADFPALLPLDPILAANADSQITKDTDKSLQARARALRARANRLRQLAEG